MSLKANKKTAITPTRDQNYPQWYQAVIKKADLAETSIVRGCMVIKPYGYSIWESIQQTLDRRIKDTGHQNFYFPLFVPLSFMNKEAEHVAGFAKECAVVTHHRLRADSEKGLVPEGELEEPLVVRPTSEAIIGEAFSRWIRSYRDLPLLGNQWANIVRWEMRTRLFLRTSEFLWQEGHTAHATRTEAIEEAEKMLAIYRELLEDFLAIPVVVGEKTQQEKFPGAEVTYCLEAMMQDKKALQAGTSHLLGQNFAKAFNIKFLTASGEEAYVWTTSWGVSTRLIGGLIMTHSDDNGLVLPPKLAPIQVVIVPLLHKSEDQEAHILQSCEALAKHLQQQTYDQKPVRVQVDTKTGRPGDKLWGWIKKGVPIVVEVGPRELQEHTVFFGRRDQATTDKQSLSRSSFIDGVGQLLADIQEGLFNRAKDFQAQNTHFAQTKSDFYTYFEANHQKTGFVLAYWGGDDQTEAELKQRFKVTARCIPQDTKHKRGQCIFTGVEQVPLTLFARAY